MWIPPEEKDPIVLHAPTRKSIAVFGGVCTEDGRFVYYPSKIFNAKTFKIFLQMLLKRRRKGKKILLVLDNARYHHARDIQPWLDKNKKHLELLFLPPYSPDLNPIERVWKLTRRLCTHNQYFENLEKLTEVVSVKFNEWKKPNSTLRKLCAI
jgi:transposase